MKPLFEKSRMVQANKKLDYTLDTSMDADSEYLQTERDTDDADYRSARVNEEDPVDAVDSKADLLEFLR
jgi:hypothetical protein